MDENVFWFNLWRTVAIAVTVILLSLMVYHANQNKLWYESWNNCVDSGGQPLEDTVKGSDVRSLTCVQHQ